MRVSSLRGIYLLIAAIALGVSPVIAVFLIGARFSSAQSMLAFLIGSIAVGTLLAPILDREARPDVACWLLLVGRCSAFFTVMIILLYGYAQYTLDDRLYAGPQDLFENNLWWTLNLTPILILAVSVVAWREPAPCHLWFFTLVATTLVILTTNIWNFSVLATLWLYIQSAPLNPLPLCLLFGATSYIALTRKALQFRNARTLMLWDAIPLLVWFSLLAVMGTFKPSFAQTGVFGGYIWPPIDFLSFAIWAAAGGGAHLLLLRAFTLTPATTLAPFLLFKAALFPLVTVLFGMKNRSYGGYFAPTFDFDTTVTMIIDDVGVFFRPEASVLILLALLAGCYWFERDAMKRSGPSNRVPSGSSPW